MLKCTLQIKQQQQKKSNLETKLTLQEQQKKRVKRLKD